MPWEVGGTPPWVWSAPKCPSPGLTLQLIEFLDVVDEPILGYDPPTVITVLHTHLFSCAVDYRYGWGEPGCLDSLLLRRGEGAGGPEHVRLGAWTPGFLSHSGKGVGAWLGVVKVPHCSGGLEYVGLRPDA